MSSFTLFFRTAALAAVALIAGAAPAAVITFTAADFTNTNQLSTKGMLVEAINFGSSNNTHDVTANGIFFDANLTAGAHISVQNGSVFSSTNLYPATSNITGLTDAEAIALFQRQVFGSGSGSDLITLSGLTVGQAYEIQLLIFDNRATSDGRTITASQVDDGTPSVTVTHTATWVQLISGTFIADAPTQLFDLSQSDTNNAQISAYQLRAIPEPNSVALSLAGLLSLALIGWHLRSTSRS